MAGPSITSLDIFKILNNLFRGVFKQNFENRNLRITNLIF